MTPVGLPHSEIPGSKRACRSPRHIAACHVFHRLSVPRHPPSTLSNLTIKCLDLMRSAASTETTSFNKRHSSSLCISIYNPYSIVKETTVSKTNGERNDSYVLTVRLQNPKRQPAPGADHAGSAEFLACCGNLLNQKEVRPISALP